MSRFALLAFVFSCSVPHLAQAGFVTLASAQWQSTNGGNDRWYALIESTTGQVSWDTARIASENLIFDNRYGHLATFTSASDWTFARDTLLEPFRREFDQAWLGATDNVVEGNWQWITGETFTYSAPATFDNLSNEDYLMAWRFQPNDPLQWNDVNNTTSFSNRALVEFGGVTAVPEPSSLLLFGSLCLLRFIPIRNLLRRS